LKMPDPVTGVSAGASVLGGLLSSQGQRAAASTQADAANRAIELQDRQRQAEIARLQPQFEAGTNALRQMQGGAFAQPAAFRFGAGDYQADPGYAFRLAEGQKALDRQAAARGGLISGSALKAAQRYGQDMGSQEFGNAYNRALTGYNANVARSDTGYNRLAAMAGLGQTAGTQIGTAGQNYATNVGNLTGQAGQAIGAGQIGAGNTYNNAIQAALQGYQNNQMMDLFRNRRSAYDAPYNANTFIPMQPGGGY
jgi:hypothetical protein